MNIEAQNVAIAKACGWSCIRNANTMAIGGVWSGHPPQNAIIGHPKKLPNFVRDLDAMREAEESLHPAEIEKYADFLGEILMRFWTLEKWQQFSIRSVAYAFAHATAAQKAEAFLLTKGKWE